MRFAGSALICGLWKWLLGKVIQRIQTHVSYRLCAVSVCAHLHAYTYTRIHRVPV